MGKTVSIYDAKSRLSQLVDEAANGREVIIARNGRPVARLVPFQPLPVARKPGRLRGKIRIGRDFDDPLPADWFDSEA
jgi:prevent-host-death family protein